MRGSVFFGVGTPFLVGFKGTPKGTTFLGVPFKRTRPYGSTSLL